MIEITIESDTITPSLNLMIGRMDDFSEPLTAILADGLFSAQEQIVEGKGSLFGGATWAPMAPATIKKGRDPETLLFETGALAQSLTRGSTGNIFEVSPTEGEAGTGLTSPRNGYGYAAGQQNPGAAKRPARMYLAWYEERFPDYERLISDWIIGDEGSDA